LYWYIEFSVFSSQMLKKQDRDMDMN